MACKTCPITPALPLESHQFLGSLPLTSPSLPFLFLDPDWHSFTSGLCTFCSLPGTVLWMTDSFASFKCYLYLGEAYIDLHLFKIPVHPMYAPSRSVFFPRCLAPLTCDTIPPVSFFPLEWKPCGNRCVFFVFFPAVFPVPGR